MEPLRLERLPPETVTSPLLKEVPGLRLKAKETRAVSPVVIKVSLLLIVTLLAMPVRPLAGAAAALGWSRRLRRRLGHQQCAGVVLHHGVKPAQVLTPPLAG